MITVEFHGYSNADEYIDNTRVDVEDIFLQYYPDLECETMIFKEDEEFKFVFKGEWSNVEDIDEDVIRDICQSYELYGHIKLREEYNKSYYYDEDDVFVYR